MNAKPPPPPPPPTPPYGRPQPPQPQPGPIPPGIQIDRSRLRPRSFWYWIAGVLAIASIGGAIAVFAATGDDIDSLTDVISDITEFSAPGETTVTLEAGDEESIYRLVRDASGQVGPPPSVANRLRCRVTGPSGDPVPLSTSLGFSTFDLNRNHYVAAFGFDATESGTYRVGCLTPRGAPMSLLIGPELDIGEIFGIFKGVFGGIAILIIGFIGVIAIVLPVAIMRSNSKRKLQREAAAAGF